MPQSLGGTMQKILRSPASIRRKQQRGTFGVPLSELTRSAHGGLQIPTVVKKIVEYILANGLNTEGIFRINGSTKAVDKMKVKFDRSQEVDLDDAGDIMAVAGLLKLFLRELPDPLMTKMHHEKFIILQRAFVGFNFSDPTENILPSPWAEDTGFLNRLDSEDYLNQLKNLIKKLPEENQLVLAYLVGFLVKVMDHQEENKMSSRALAIVFGPNLFRCSEGVAGLQEQAYTNVIVRTMIEEYDTLFGDETDEIGIPSKRILVKPSEDKRSPEVKPISYEAYLKERIGKAFAKRDVDGKDVNSNSVADKETRKTPDSRQDTVSPCEVSSADERALSPFNLDSDSTVPSPVVSDSAIEVVNRTIKQCVNEFVYGTTDANAPVPTPRTKRLQKKKREEAQTLPSHSADTKEAVSMDAKDRGRLASFDSLDSVSPPTTPLPKSVAESPAFKLFESRGNKQPVTAVQKGSKAPPTKPEVKKADKDPNNTHSPSSRRKDRGPSEEEAVDNVFADDFDQIQRDQILDKITSGRAPSPKRHHQTTRSSIRSKDSSEKEVPTQLTELDLDSVQREAPVLSKLTRGRSQGPKRRSRSRSKSRERSESEPWSPTTIGHSELTNGSIQQQSPEPAQGALIMPPKAKHKLGGTHRLLAEAAMATRRQQQASKVDEPAYENTLVGVSQKGPSTQEPESVPHQITPPKPKYKMGGTPNLLAEAAAAARRTQKSPDPDPSPKLITPPKPKYKMGGTPNLLAEAAVAARRNQQSPEVETTPQLITASTPKHKMGGTPNILAGAAMAAVLKKKQGPDGEQEPGTGKKQEDRPVSPGSKEETGTYGGKGHKGKHHHDKKHDADGPLKQRTKKDKSQQDVSRSPGKKDKRREDLQARDTDSPEAEAKESRKKRSGEKLTNGKEERSRSTSPKSPRPGEEEEDDTIPSLDLTSLHVNTESEEPIPAWNLQQRADWLNNMEELTIDVRPRPIDEVSKSWEEAPLSPRAKDTPPCWGSSTIESERIEDAPVDRAQNIKQLTRQVRSLKRRIRQYEEDYIQQHGHKPSTAEKVAEPEVKKMMKELKKAAKQLKAAKDEGEGVNKPLHSTLPGRRKILQEDSNSESSIVDSLRDAMDLAAEYLKEKRKEAGRMDDIFEMSKTEVHDEKISIQKVLLQLENKFGRPTTKETKEIMKPLYDRYRNLKRLIAKFEVRRTLAEEVTGSATDLNTIEENEETKEFTPKQMGTVHTMYADDDEPCMVTQEISSGVRGHPRTLDGEDTIQSPVDLSGRADSPLSPDSTANFKNLAESSLSDLIKAQNQALADKKRIRRILKEYEDNFFREKGRKVQKEDRGPMEEEYNEYKQLKKQLKLLDALMEKHESQVNTGVT